MLLIADSGSTKTDWRLIDEQTNIVSFSSEGINPFFHTPDTVAQILRSLSIDVHNDVNEVFFYGAGCSNEDNMEIVRKGFKEVFPNAVAHVQHDLLGAARALFKNEDGIAGILGTGSNSCLFLNDQVSMNLGGQGYIIGDEGSGLHIGRKLIRDYMNHLMPADVESLFEEDCSLSRKQIIDAIYNKPYPNRFLASFSETVSSHIDHPYMKGIAKDAIGKFMDRYIKKYPNYNNVPLRLVGSVAFYYQDIIEEEAHRIGVKVDKILKTPIDGLVQFHTD